MAKESNNEILTNAHHDFARGLSRYVHLKIHDVATGDDLVQTTFMKTWLYLQKSGKIDLMRAFLYHILNLLIIDEYRRKKPISLDVLTEDGLELAAVNSEGILNIIDAKVLASLIKKLPDKYRSAITMRYTDELSLKEMSAITHKSQNTMAVQVHRGLAKLRSLSRVEA
jgi:RNA polymerase sigma-70 factor (ECF subfamily)